MGQRSFLILGILGLLPFIVIFCAYFIAPPDKNIYESCYVLGRGKSLEEFIKSDRYTSIPDTPDGIAIKRDLLDSAADNLLERARVEADARIEQEAMDVGASYTYSDRLRWQRLNRIDKRRIDAEYKMLFGGENNVSVDRDKTITIGGQRVNVLAWAINRSKAIRGKKGAFE